MAQPTIFQASVGRRWIIIVVAGVILATFALTNGAPTILFVGAVVAVFAGINSLAWLIARTTTSHPSFGVAAFLLDVAIATAGVAVIGSGGLLVAYLAVLTPYLMPVSPRVSRFFIAAAVICYVAGMAIHGVYFAVPSRGWTEIATTVWLEVAVFVVAAASLRMATTRLNTRLRSIRLTLPQTESLPATNHADELDKLEVTFRDLTNQLEATVNEVSSDTATIVQCANAVHGSAERAAEANAKLVSSSGVVVEGLEVQRRGAEAGERRGKTAIEYARELGDRASKVAGQVGALLEHAESARKQIQRSHESLGAIEHDVGGTLSAMDGLKNTVRGANEALETVLSIARQTHVLALNTAIKSANGEISQDASTEIAARFRSLAADTSASTRAAAQFVDEITEHVAVAERAMRAGQVQARDAVMFTETATAVLQELHLAALRSNELVGASVDVTRIQTEHLDELSKHLSDAATSRIDTTQYIASASQSVTCHRSTMKELEQAVATLSDTADRIARHFSSLSAIASRNTNNGAGSQQETG